MTLLSWRFPAFQVLCVPICVCPMQALQTTPSRFRHDICDQCDNLPIHTRDRPLHSHPRQGPYVIERCTLFFGAGSKVSTKREARPGRPRGRRLIMAWPMSVTRSSLNRVACSDESPAFRRSFAWIFHSCLFLTPCGGSSLEYDQTLSLSSESSSLESLRTTNHIGGLAVRRTLEQRTGSSHHARFLIIYDCRIHCVGHGDLSKLPLCNAQTVPLTQCRADVRQYRID